MTVARKHSGPGLLLVVLGVPAVAVALLAAQPALAADNGPTQTGEICMQKVFGTPVASSNKLNCTANDISLARAISVSPSSCIEGSTIDLTATFEVNVTANARYDAGFFFRIDGGGNARGDGEAASGTCSLSALTRGLDPAISTSLDDGDTCGDLNAGTYNVTFTIPDVVCAGVPDPENPGQKVLALPNCTSWHSNQGTACTIDDPFSLANAFDFRPDTKSKCVCDDDFTVPVIVEDATLTVTKTASPTSVPETGQTVTYTVQVTNDASFVSVTITTIDDDVYGDLTDATNALVTSNTCPTLVGTVLAPGGNASCTFQVFTSGNAGASITDTVDLCGTQSGNGNTVCDDDDATVTITDVASTPAVTKTATTATACSLTVDVTYTVGVSNPSTVDTLTVNSLTDDKFGDITQVQGNVISTTCVPDASSATCEAGGTIAAAGSCSCTFVGRTTSTSCTGYSHVNTVTGNVTDDDGVTPDPLPTASANVDVDVDVTFP